MFYRRDIIKKYKMIHSYKNLLKASFSRRSLHSVYAIQPQTGALEQEKQASFLTKTVVKEGPPDRVANILQQNQEQGEEMVAQLRNSIIETIFFHKDEPLKFPKRMRERTRAYKLAQYKSRMSSKVLSNMLNVIWTNSMSRYCFSILIASFTSIFYSSSLTIHIISYTSDWCFFLIFNFFYRNLIYHPIGYKAFW